MAPRPHDDDEPVGDPVGGPADGDSPGGPDDGRYHDRDRTGPPGPDEIQARWEEIVARLQDVSSQDAPPTTQRPEPGDDDGSPEQPGAVVRPSQWGRPTQRADPAEALRGWVPDPDVEEAENHFDPPDPGPVLGGDPLLTMAWGAAIGAPVVFVLSVLLWQDMPTLLLQIAGVLFVAGAGLLVWRLPNGSDDDDHGPGAVV